MLIAQRLPSWAALQNHAIQARQFSLRELFAHDANRVQRFSRRFDDLLVDYSKHLISEDTFYLLLQMARELDLPQWIDQLFSGDLVNHTEQRAALHIALRRPKSKPLIHKGKNIVAEVHHSLDRLGQFADQVRQGKWLGATGKRLRHIVNIGIGGSDLGPKMVCEALSEFGHPDLQVHFMSSVDDVHVQRILRKCDPETTLFIVASKTFTTQETMTNAQTARAWITAALGHQAVVNHFVAVSTNIAAAVNFGIAQTQVFGFWDWVGGRYSLWSAVGLPIILSIGLPRFQELLAGAHAMDEHFQHTSIDDNLPVILALLGVWYSHFFDAKTHAILPYDDRLRYLPNYLQQLDMESNGKSVDRLGQKITANTGPIIWGGLGINGQHAFYQLLHQGTHLVPVDFFAAAQKSQTPSEHHAILLANAFAQAEALMKGKTTAEARQELESQGLSATAVNALLPYKIFSGNKPSTFFLYKQLTPRMLGMLLALYEHKVFVQSVIWNLNPFDQFGVELGKQLAKGLLPAIRGGELPKDRDASTLELIRFSQ